MSSDEDKVRSVWAPPRLVPEWAGVDGKFAGGVVGGGVDGYKEGAVVACVRFKAEAGNGFFLANFSCGGGRVWR